MDHGRFIETRHERSRLEQSEAIVRVQAQEIHSLRSQLRAAEIAMTTAAAMFAEVTSPLLACFEAGSGAPCSQPF